jgi:hypothetical protein
MTKGGGEQSFGMNSSARWQLLNAEHEGSLSAFETTEEAADDGVGSSWYRHSFGSHRHFPPQAVEWLLEVVLGRALNSLLFCLFLGSRSGAKGSASRCGICDLGWRRHYRRCCLGRGGVRR